ncbi:sigma-54 dependent transcriptional regulator [Longimicrobium sp.]|uniref:sigma-54-dependent transcriptional regulator n=1 Tax=Longimicrobium sp. TaxID=2029185 RepID=UPI002CBFCE1F|nr:sigma-54 dependent transcriptional regulator [Longimicrobium sp.]HSU13072.1 sigma-54 dependent transcriptional regulator [Longimicrobium sp.]
MPDPVTSTAVPAPAEGAASISLLLVEDEYTLRDSCANVLRLDGYTVTACAHGREAVQTLARRAFDVALVDLYLDDLSGLEVLAACLQANPRCLVVVMTGSPSVDSSVEALRQGAWDYLPKPFSATHLQILVGRAARAVAEARAEEALRSAAESGGPRQSHSRAITLLGRSPAFVRAVELARRVAQTDASVFITGESGTGKEMIAQFIHSESRRAQRAMVAVNCAALPESLLESEMFGHVKGAFTGAIRDKVGLLEAADGGTFFLDELTEMTQTIQAKLLRVLQDGIVRRVGSETTDATVDVRVIAATNRDPSEATDTGVLRRDLYYRLSVVPIYLPPLRERPEDVPLLAEHFLGFYWRRHREAGAPAPRLSPAAVSLLQARPWRGNVRELQNLMEHTVVLVAPGAEVHPDDIPFRDDSPRGGRPRAGAEPQPYALVGDEPYHSARDRVLAEFERMYLMSLVERAGANMSRAAKIAGVDRTTLYRLMEKHGLHRDTAIRVD